MRSLKSLTDN